MGLDDLVAKAKDAVEDRGGTEALNEDAMEDKDDLSQEGGLADKAKAMAEDLKDPGAPGS